MFGVDARPETTEGEPLSHRSESHTVEAVMAARQ